jgi:hypothetical protein
MAFAKYLPAVLSLLAALLGSDIAAQADTTAPGAPLITHFAEMPWGSTRAQIVARYGRPDDEAVSGSIRILTYTRTLFGERAVVGYGLHSRFGLIVGSYAVRVADDDCLAKYHTVRTAVREMYPDQVVLVDREENESTVSFCIAVLVGDAKAQMALRDSATTVVMVSISPMPTEVTVLYYTRRALDILEAEEAAAGRGPRN